jgi:hypothetical protein
MLRVVQARSEMQYEQVRRLFAEYRQEIETRASAGGACP